MSLPHTFFVSKFKKNPLLLLPRWELNYGTAGAAIALINPENSNQLFFAVPIASSSTPYRWEYSLDGSNWSGFGMGAASPDIIHVPEGFVSNNQLFYYYARSAAWGVGNENYVQRWTGPETNIINNETAKLSNNAGNFP